MKTAVFSTTVTVETLKSGQFQASMTVKTLGKPEMSFSPTTGLPGATEDQALFNLFRGQATAASMSDLLTHAYKVAGKGKS